MISVLLYVVERRGYCLMVEKKSFWGLFTSSYPVVCVGGSKEFVSERYLDSADAPTFFTTIDEAYKVRKNFIETVLQAKKASPPTISLLSKIDFI